ncbi:MAG: RDD family protein [Actinobacteria bacterium]|nr:RDD family protein [Actinomycetota bacterium]
MGGWKRTRGAWEALRRAKAEEATRRQTVRWTTERDDLLRRLTVAEAAQAPAAGPRQWLGVQLAAGEHELFSLPEVALVEASQTVERGRTGYAEIGINMPISVKVGGQRSRSDSDVDEPTIIDIGNATITNRRVLFAGPKYTRVFELGELVHVEPAADCPIVYFHARGRDSTTGLRFAPRLLRAVVEHLEIAIAVSRGEGDVLIATLRQQLRHHDDGRPAVMPAPPLALPAQTTATPPSPPPPVPLSTGAPSVAAQLLKQAAMQAGRGLRTVIARRPARSAAIVAGLPRRLVARVVDTFVYLFIGAFVTVPFQETTADGVRTATEVGVVVWLGSVLVLELGLALTVGSLGKLWLGITIVDAETGKRPPASRVVMRTIVGAALALTVIGLVVDWAYAFLDGRRRSVHDRAGRTLVRRRAASPAPGAVPST